MLRHRPFILPIAVVLMAANNGAAPAPDAAFKSLAPLTAAIVDGGQIQGQLKVTLAVSGSDETALDQGIPLIRAAAVSALSEHARLRASPYAAVNAEALSHDLDKAVRKAAPAVSRVLLVRVEAQSV